MELKDAVALIALCFSIWNFYRLRIFQNRIEYKDTRKIYKDCLSETKDLIEKITIEMASLMQRRIDFDLLDSGYIGSYGFQQAYQEFMKHYNSMNQQKDKSKQIYQALSDTLHLSEKIAFEKLIHLHKSQKDVYLEFIDSYANAKTQIDGIENMATYQKGKA